MGKVISIINMKGGVGKTTLSIGNCRLFIRNWEKDFINRCGSSI